MFVMTIYQKEKINDTAIAHLYVNLILDTV